MTFLDLHPLDPCEARFKVIATLYLLSELGVIASRDIGSSRASGPGRGRAPSPKRVTRGGTRPVRPPRSC